MLCLIGVGTPVTSAKGWGAKASFVAGRSNKSSALLERQVYQAEANDTVHGGMFGIGSKPTSQPHCVCPRWEALRGASCAVTRRCTKLSSHIVLHSAHGIFWLQLAYAYFYCGRRDHICLDERQPARPTLYYFQQMGL